MKDLNQLREYFDYQLKKMGLFSSIDENMRCFNREINFFIVSYYKNVLKSLANVDSNEKIDDFFVESL